MVTDFRNMERPPVPLHAIDSGLAASMHAEIKALYGLLLDAAKSLGINPDDTEKAIVYRLEETKKFYCRFCGYHSLRAARGCAKCGANIPLKEGGLQ